MSFSVSVYPFICLSFFYLSVFLRNSLFCLAILVRRADFYLALLALLVDKLIGKVKVKVLIESHFCT